MKKYRLLLAVLLLCILASCTVPPDTSEIPPEDDGQSGEMENAEDDIEQELRDEPYAWYYEEYADIIYVDYFAPLLPEDTPLETLQALYPELNIKSYRDYYFVVRSPKGTPDNHVKDSVFYALIPQWITAEGVRISVPEQVSVDFENFEIILEKTDEPQELLYRKAPRIEKWIDAEWKRIYYFHEDFSMSFWDKFAENHLLSNDEGKYYRVSAIGQGTITVSRDEWITPVEPGKYRVMVYVGYEETPMYAEFTIEE